ncbi:MAG: DUF3137 domain-containing protein [Clostridia bacterium]|nr:DUF3137 domain-containing protein [Clostridia bacterium]
MSIREEMARQEVEKKKRILKLLYAFIGIGVIICFFNILIGLLIVIPLVILIVAAQTAKDIKHESQDFYGKILNEMAPKILKEVLPDAERFPEEGITKEEYILSEFVESCDKYASRDKIITPLILDGNKVNEIELYDLSHEITDGADDKFYGIYAKISLPKDIRTKIKISSEGKYADGNIFKYEMDNKTFENVFDVMAMNKKTVVDILTDDIMNFMLEIYNKYNYRVEVNILRNMMHVRVIGKPEIIQASYGSEIDRIAVDNHYNIMKEVNELIHRFYANISKLEI